MLMKTLLTSQCINPIIGQHRVFPPVQWRFLPSRVRKSEDVPKAASRLALEGNFYRHDRKSINHQRQSLNSGLFAYRHFYRQPVPLAGDSYR
ncbi:hypothetical protein Dpoa569_0000964 [Dickeya poaceiphila]|uniref:Uncharacterized protein n=1 Tax=Dickeya poaceiphila TaxID=568768 RepID=A0A5B8I1T6_9GAMM|nr:hypothetical protein Dpoa569_0000964 [Dickeya poaceiphila]